ncbi:DgyrCDS11418 [Dimorphilus gyrociliatus]|uniref:DgyrCDS11418 n=1 Tax=Dimorphilus gyrociliatus TaxID=2664684 RepID=A0A7I8W4K3_9ANNE|nr:DgyrCDS11418 [Dimorphilus gyrociliatus]
MNVIIPVDGSERSESALDWYKTHAHMEANTVWLIHCAKMPSLDAGGGEVFLTADMYSNALLKLKAEVKKYEEKCTELLKSKGINGRVKTFFNSRVGEVIVEAAKELNAGLIIVSSRGHGSVRRAVLGSVCDYLIHEAPCNVAVHMVKSRAQ